jgi:hypothetical protein
MVYRNGTGVGFSSMTTGFWSKNYRTIVTGDKGSFDMHHFRLENSVVDPNEYFLDYLRADYRSRFFGWRYTLYSTPRKR